MTTSDSSPRNQVANEMQILRGKVLELESNEKRYRRYIEQLESALRSQRRKMFASSSEKWTEEEQKQRSLFDEIEASANEQEAAEYSDEVPVLPEGQKPEDGTITVPAHDRKKPGRRPLPANLPRREVIVDLPENEQICATHGKPLKEIGRDVSERLEIIPMQMTVVRTVVIKYGCPCKNCGVKTAPVQPQMIPKSNSTAGLLAFISISKFQDALPLYRLENIFKRYGIEISRGAMAQWMIVVALQLRILYELLEEDLLQSPYIQCDETPVQVLREKNRKATTKSYMWVKGRSGEKPIVLFKYAASRSGETAKGMLANFKGFLQVDGYGGYNCVCKQDGVIRIGCLYHARRKFYDALKSSVLGKNIAKDVLRIIKAISKEDEKVQLLPMEKRMAEKEAKVRPLFVQLKSLVDEKVRTLPPKTKIGEAMLYTINEWPNLLGYFLAPEIEVSTNFIENAIRPFALGRKNWLFFATVDGVQASEVIYSIIETAKANGKEPYEYLKHLFEQLPLCKTQEDFRKLLPF